eukprot:g4187.t1
MLVEDTSIQHRNRAMSMAQFFSMSRFDELQRWRVSDLHLFNYGSELPTMGNMDMTVVLVTMSSHKQLKNGGLPDEKLLVRHNNPILCPLFAISYMLFDRFVTNGEKPLDLLAHGREWYDIKLFRSSKDSHQSLNKTTLYKQRKTMLQKTGTYVNGIVNHLDRKLGAIAGKLCGLDATQVQKVGLWDSNTLSRHYDKLPEPDIPAKLAGFENSQKFYIERANASLIHFCQKNESASHFFGCYFPFLDNDAVKQGTIALQHDGDNTPHHVFRTLGYLRSIFFQDIVFIRDLFPSLTVFSSPPFSTFPDIFELWCTFVHDQVKKFSILEKKGLQEDNNEQWKSHIERKTAHISTECEANSKKLDQIMHFLQEKLPSVTTSNNRRESALRNNSAHGLPILKKMRCFNEMTLREVFDECTHGFEVGGVQYPSLKSLEKSRCEEGKQYRDPSLRTIIGKRMMLSTYIEEQAVLLGSLDDSLKVAEELQQELGGKRPCSLNQFWVHLKKKQKTE